jgi:phosphocarrier protein HPr
LQIFIGDILTAVSYSVNKFKLTKVGFLLDSGWLNGWYLKVTKGPKKYKVAKIKNELGLHARSAAQIARLAGKSAAGIWLKKDDQMADASSIIDILTLACEKGTKLTIIIEDLADISILDAIVDLVDSGFGE